MKALIVSCICAAAAPAAAYAAEQRGAGWEFGFDVIYQDGADLSFDGGSSADLEDDFGLSVYGGYRFTDHLELQFGLDWETVDYDVSIRSAQFPDVSFDGRGELESITPWVSVNYNFIDGDLTPFVTGGVGWSFVDTNIPNGPVEVGCWWDPWWGYVCTPYQSTKTIDDPSYRLGAGVRWDLSCCSLRLAYEKQWFDYSNASSTPEFDQFKLGIAFRY